MSNKISENIPIYIYYIKNIPKDLPIKKYTNFIIGIIQNKIFF